MVCTCNPGAWDVEAQLGVKTSFSCAVSWKPAWAIGDPVFRRQNKRFYRLVLVVF